MVSGPVLISYTLETFQHIIEGHVDIVCPPSWKTYTSQTV